MDVGILIPAREDGFPYNLAIKALFIPARSIGSPKCSKRYTNQSIQYDVTK